MQPSENSQAGQEDGETVQSVGETSDDQEAAVKASKESYSEQQQPQERLCYSNGDDGREDVGVLEAGQPEMKNGVLVDASNANVVVNANDQEHDCNNYNYRTINYGQMPEHIIHTRYLYFM